MAWIDKDGSYGPIGDGGLPKSTYRPEEWAKSPGAKQLTRSSEHTNDQPTEEPPPESKGIADE